MPINRIGVSLDREDFMETFIRVLAALLFLAGVAILVIDMIYAPEEKNYIFYLIADGVFLLAAVFVVFGMKLGTLFMWLSAALNIYCIFYSKDIKVGDAIKTCLDRFAHGRWITENDPMFVTLNVLTFFIIVLLPLIMTILVQRNQSKFR